MCHDLDSNPHSTDYTRAEFLVTPTPTADLKLNFGRQGVTTCPEFTRPAGTDSSMTSWTPSRIEGVTSFTVQIGQSGGERGYTGITGGIRKLTDHQRQLSEKIIVVSFLNLSDDKFQISMSSSLNFLTSYFENRE